MKKALRWLGGAVCGGAAVVVGHYVDPTAGAALGALCATWFAPEAVKAGKLVAGLGMSWKRPRPLPLPPRKDD